MNKEMNLIEGCVYKEVHPFPRWFLCVKLDEELMFLESTEGFRKPYNYEYVVSPESIIEYELVFNMENFIEITAGGGYDLEEIYHIYKEAYLIPCEHCLAGEKLFVHKDREKDPEKLRKYYQKEIESLKTEIISRERRIREIEERKEKLS